MEVFLKSLSEQQCTIRGTKSCGMSVWMQVLGLDCPRWHFFA